MTDIPNEIKDVLDDDSTQKSTLLEVIDGGGEQFFVIEQGDDETSEVFVVKYTKGSAPIFIDNANDLPSALSAGTSGGFSAREYLSYREEEPTQVDDGAANITAAISLNPKIAQAAQSAVGDPYMNSGAAAGTNGGRLACAWAVNRLVKRKLGAPIGGGLGTATMYPILKARHLVPNGDPAAGAIIISPSVQVNGRKKTGHVGVLGEDNKIYSNSSSRARWEQNYTKSKWEQFFRGRGLNVYYFNLNAKYFPHSAAIS